MDKNYIEELATAFHSSEQITAAMMNIIDRQRSDATKEAIKALWLNPTSKQRDLIKKKSMLFAIIEEMLLTDEYEIEEYPYSLDD